MDEIDRALRTLKRESGCIAENTRGLRCGNDTGDAYWMPLAGIPLCAYHLNAIDRSVRRFVELEAQMLRTSRAQAKREAERARHVYYVRQRDYIKIGVAVDLRSRVRSLSKPPGGCRRPDDLPVEPVSLLASHLGGIAAERAIHDRFRDLRTVGEWFHAAPDLLDHIDHINSRKAA